MIGRGSPETNLCQNLPGDVSKSLPSLGRICVSQWWSESAGGPRDPHSPCSSRILGPHLHPSLAMHRHQVCEAGLRSPPFSARSLLTFLAIPICACARAGAFSWLAPLKCCLTKCLTAAVVPGTHSSVPDAFSSASSPNPQGNPRKGADYPALHMGKCEAQRG